MTAESTDPKYVRDGVDLGTWLMRLVTEDDPHSRLVIANRLQAMAFDVPVIPTDLELDIDWEQSRDNFKIAIRKAVEAEGFDTASFIAVLCVGMRAGIHDLMHQGRADQTDDKRPEIRSNLTAEAVCAKLPWENQESCDRAAKRLGDAVNKVRDRRIRIRDMSVSSQVHRMESTVFFALDRAFLKAPESVQWLLDQRDTSHVASMALMNIGPAGIMFAPQLLDRTTPNANGTFNSFGKLSRYCDIAAASALGAVGRGDERIVEILLNRLDHQLPEVRHGAIVSIREMGPSLAGRETQVMNALLRLLDMQDHPKEVIEALASIGEGNRRICQRLLKVVHPGPMVPSEVQSDDTVMSQRRAAIDAMKQMTAFPNDCIPVLIDAMDSFVEFDPEGPLGRISRVLEHFGPAASPAVVPLASHLKDFGNRKPTAILEVLRRMGPVARQALPLLEAFKIQFSKDLKSEESSELITLLNNTIDRVKGLDLSKPKPRIVTRFIG